MRGIFGISERRHVAVYLYEGLIQLQHRGQDAAGIVVPSDSCFLIARGQGYAREAFSETSVRTFKGNLGIAYTHYTTAVAPVVWTAFQRN